MTALRLATCLFLYWLLASPSIAAESFGRLFTTPAERSSLDYLRQTTKAPVVNEAPEALTETAPAVPVIPQPVSMQGYVKRSDGRKGTVWVNGQPMQEGSSNDAVQIGKLGKDSNEVPLAVPSIGKSIRLKAGQVYRPGSDSVSEINAHNSTEQKGTIADPNAQTVTPDNLNNAK